MYTDGLIVMVEATYSPERREEMRKSKEKNCYLIISLIKSKIKELGGSDIEVQFPKEKEESIDIIFKFYLENSEKIEILERELNKIKSKGVSSIKVFIDDVIAITS